MDSNEATMAVGAIAGIGSAGAKSVPGLEKFSEALGVVSKNAMYLSGVSDGLTENLKTLSGLLSKDVASSLDTIATKLKDQINSFQELDKAIIQLGRGEGSRAYIESMRKQSFEALNLGISLEKIVEINKLLLENYNGALLATDRQTESFNKNREAMTNLIGFNQKFNVSQSTSIELLNNFNNVMGGGTKAAQTFSDILLIFSQKTGQSASKVFADFNQSVDRFSILTADKAVAAFQKLELTAARTGQGISKVIESVERFDDIEEGFKAGGQLNRVLSFMGGSFDTFAAMQADDQTRATMLYEAISGVSDKYSQLQTDQAKRSFARQLAESSGIDMKTVVGLLNKSTNLSKDIADMAKTPIVSEEFTKQGRENAAMRLTTAEELKNIQLQLLDFNPIVVNLSDTVKANTESFTKFSGKFIEAAEKNIVNQPKGSTPLETAYNSLKTFVDVVKGLPSAWEQQQSEFSKTKKVADSIITNNTTAISELKGIMSKGIKVEVSGHLNTPTGKVDLKQTPGEQKSAAQALHAGGKSR